MGLSVDGASVWQNDALPFLCRDYASRLLHLKMVVTSLSPGSKCCVSEELTAKGDCLLSPLAPALFYLGITDMVGHPFFR